MLSIRLQTERKQTISHRTSVFQFPYPVPHPADLPPPSTAEEFFAAIAMLLLVFSLVLWLLPGTIRPMDFPHDSWRRLAVHRSGSLDSSASGASSVNATTGTAKLRLLALGVARL